MNSTDVVLRIIRVLNELQIPYMVVGAFSTNYYGRPRSTKDADFVAALEAPMLRQLKAALGPEFRMDEQMSFETVTMHPRHLIVHVGTTFRIELFELTDDPFNQLRFQRRRQVDFAGEPAWLPSAEDVIIQKLLWGAKRTDRGQDVVDATQVIRLQKNNGLDLDYIRHWTGQHGTLELFEKLWAE